MEEEERGDIVLSSECHRGYPLRSLNEIICLCPTNYYGSQCQYQKQRISLTLRFQTYSDSRRTLFAVVIQLIDNSSQRLVHSSKQLTYIYIKHCQTKFKFYLTYLNYRKEINRSYFIHINFYEKLTFAYRGSLYIPIEFVFLPVHRLSYVLTIPRDNRSMMTMPNPLNSTCSLDSLFVGYHRHRPICICPRTKWGPRCFLRNHICQQSTCFNQGQCILTDDEMISEKKFFCICPKGFSGDRCQIEDTKIVITFDDNIILTDMILVHFIEIQQFGLVKNGSTFQSIPFYQRNVTIRWSHPFHIVFIQLTNRMFYLIHIQTNSTSSNSKIEKFIRSSDRCGQMNEYFNETIVNSHLIRRIKFYHLPCQNNSLLTCFYDRDHFCLCQNFGFQRIANCFEFNSTLIHNCYKLSNCQNNGQCIQTSNQTFTCQCVFGWQGIRCETKINYCSNVTCFNQGVCQPLFLNYSCLCLGAGYSGRYCEIAPGRITALKLFSKSMAYIVIIAIVLLALFMMTLDVLKYCFGIDPTVSKPKEKKPRIAIRFIYVSKISEEINK